MTNEEKRMALAASLTPDTDTDEVLDNVLADAEALVLNRMYPFHIKKHRLGTKSAGGAGNISGILYCNH